MYKSPYKKLLTIATLIIIIIAIMPTMAYGSQDKQVIMVTINQINYNDLLKMDSINDIINSSGIGLMNTRTAGTAITPKAYATIGAGIRAEGNWINSQGHHLTRENKAIYTARTGKSIPENGIINLDINKLILYNEFSEYGANIGQLGSLIRRAGLTTSAYGNMNSLDENRNPHIFIAMDKWGRVDGGDISDDILIRDSSFPGGLKTNFSRIYKGLKENPSSFTVIETGDISRLEEERDNLTPAMYEKHKLRVINEIDGFIKNILTYIEDKETLLMIVTPFASDLDYREGYKLSPVIFYGQDSQKGILTSPTTRREGIVGNVDIGPTICKYLDIEVEGMIGKPIDIIPSDNHLKPLLDGYELIVATSKNRLPVLSFFAIYQIILLFIALIMVLFKNKINLTYYPTIKNLLLSGLVIPVILLYLPVFRVKSLFLTFILTIAFTIFLSWLIYYLGKKFDNPALPIVLISMFMTIGLMGDIIIGSPLISSSLFGYDPIIGARYYGVGNEYMGVLVGSALVFFLGIKELYKKIPKFLIILSLIALIIVIGYPKWGANVGGTITGTIAMIFVFFRIYNIRISWKQVVWAVVGVAFVVAIMAIADIFFLESQSHLAGAISQIREGGIKAIITIITRKLAMNIRLFGITIWSKVLVATLIVFAILFYKPYGELKKTFNKYPYLSIGWAAIVVASITGFMVNDSGVVAAATCLIYLSFSLLYILIQEPQS